MPLPTVTANSVDIFAGNKTKLYLKQGASPAAGDLVPTTTSIEFSPSAQSEEITVYDNTGSSYTVKTGTSYQLNFETIAGDDNTMVKGINAAAQATGKDAEMLFILELPDGGYRYGTLVVESSKPMTPVRGAQRYQISARTSGPVSRQTP